VKVPVTPAVTRFPPWNRAAALRERGFSLMGQHGPSLRPDNAKKDTPALARTQGLCLCPPMPPCWHIADLSQGGRQARVYRHVQLSEDATHQAFA